jgi:hypothetical protein
MGTFFTPPLLAHDSSGSQPCRFAPHKGGHFTLQKGNSIDTKAGLEAVERENILDQSKNEFRFPARPSNSLVTLSIKLFETHNYVHISFILLHVNVFL